MQTHEEGAHGAFDEAQSRASQVGEAAKKKLAQKADAQKGQLAQSLERFARSVEDLGRESPSPEGKIFSGVAGYARRAEELIEGRRAEELASIAVRELKQRPGLLAAGCFALGFFGARLLKD